MTWWLPQDIGFSWIGFLFLLLLFVPNAIWERKESSRFAKLAANEPRWLTVIERTGQVLTTAGLLFTRGLTWHAGSPKIWWLIAAAVLMAAYEGFWIRYFGGDRSETSFYRPLAGIPVPGALLPVVAVFCMAAYSGSIFLFVSAAVLGAGHIGIHALHALQCRKTG